jgi:hypothetical protein
MSDNNPGDDGPIEGPRRPLTQAKGPGIVQAQSRKRLWRARSGTIHIVEGEGHDARALCGPMQAELRGEPGSGRPTCRKCLANLESRRHRIAQAIEKEKERDEREERRAIYMLSAEWARLRRIVFERARGICEACLEAEATEVHHTTYEHLFAEPAFDLRAVCRPCHESITAQDKARAERRGRS